MKFLGEQKQYAMWIYDSVICIYILRQIQLSSRAVHILKYKVYASQQ